MHPLKMGELHMISFSEALSRAHLKARLLACAAFVLLHCATAAAGSQSEDFH
jgi:hypothetical protein